MSAAEGIKGMERLLGQKALSALRHSRVLVVGVGGVGTWVLESLARSGVGGLGLVDLDEICVSNINRQLHALHSTVGQSKVLVMGARLKDINPELELDIIEDFYTPETSEEIFKRPYDLVIDAVDSLRAKVHLACVCRDKKIPLIMIGGAAGKRDPRKIHIADLADTLQDSLLFRVRKNLRTHHGFPLPQKKRKDGPAQKKMKIVCITSSEPAVYPDGEGGVCERPRGGDSGKLDCQTGMGSASFITGAFGLYAASVAIERLLKIKEA